jgi:hypothetical protein
MILLVVGISAVLFAAFKQTLDLMRRAELYETYTWQYHYRANLYRAAIHQTPGLSRALESTGAITPAEGKWLENASATPEGRAQLEQLARACIRMSQLYHDAARHPWRSGPQISKRMPPVGPPQPEGLRE